MREANKPETLNELMGSGDKEVTLENLKEHLGNKMPEINFDDVGRLRLIHALQQRFGSNFRQIAGVSKMLGEFDKKKHALALIKANKGSK